MMVCRAVATCVLLRSQRLLVAQQRQMVCHVPLNLVGLSSCQLCVLASPGPSQVNKLLNE